MFISNLEIDYMNVENMISFVMSLQILDSYFKFFMHSINELKITRNLFRPNLIEIIWMFLKVYEFCFNKNYYFSLNLYLLSIRHFESLFKH
jgi:hypothetical protein